MDSKRKIDVGISSVRKNSIHLTSTHLIILNLCLQFIINYAFQSLVDLKAELLKKHGELQSSRNKQGPVPSGGIRGVPKSVRKSVLLEAKNPYASKNKGIEQRSRRDLEEVKNEERTIEKAK